MAYILLILLVIYILVWLNRVALDGSPYTPPQPSPQQGYRMHTFFDLMSSVGKQDKVKG